jgi:phosphoserine aminotransferase
MQPTAKPKNPNFSSGPCSKRPGYDVSALKLDTLGRSHRSALGKKALGLACSETARILGLPEGYRVGVVPGSDTGAVEMALWSLLGQRGVDVLAWESFGSGWVTDVVKQLKLANVRRAEGRLRRHRRFLASGRTSKTTWSSPGTARPPASR